MPQSAQGLFGDAWPEPRALPIVAALLKFAPIGQILFGSDHPYVSDADNLTDLKSCGLSQAQMNAILYENAERLVPRFKG